MPEPNSKPSVLVTGASGFVGSLLLKRLSEKGRQVIALDIKQFPQSLPNVAFHKVDLSRPFDSKLLGDRGVRTVVHLAFQMREGRGRREAEKIRLVNLECLYNVMEASAAAGVEHFIYLSSHAVYGARPENPVPIDEGYKSKPSVGFQ